MSDPKRDTNFQKSARVLNAAIRELELPDELKTSAQQVVTLFATDLLPGLLRRETPRPNPGPGAYRGPRGADDDDVPVSDDALADLHRAVRAMVEQDDDDDVHGPVPTTSRAPRKATLEQVPPPPDRTESRLIHAALETLRCSQQTQLAQLQAAVADAAKRGADPLDVLDVLLAAADYRADDPALPALLALPPHATATALH